MKVPLQVTIKNVVYDVLWIEQFPENAFYGQCDGQKKQIIIQKGLSEKQTQKTFLHEVLHAIEMEHKIKIPHRLINQLETPLLRLFLENGLSFL